VIKLLWFTQLLLMLKIFLTSKFNICPYFIYYYFLLFQFFFLTSHSSND
jgi:hypothetical protein